MWWARNKKMDDNTADGESGKLFSDMVEYLNVRVLSVLWSFVCHSFSKCCCYLLWYMFSRALITWPDAHDFPKTYLHGPVVKFNTLFCYYVLLILSILIKFHWHLDKAASASEYCHTYFFIRSLCEHWLVWGCEEFFI